MLVVDLDGFAQLADMKSFLFLTLLLASCATEIKPRTYTLPMDFHYYKPIDTIKVGNTNMVLLKDPANGNKYLIDQDNKDVHPITVPEEIN